MPVNYPDVSDKLVVSGEGRGAEGQRTQPDGWAPFPLCHQRRVGFTHVRVVHGHVARALYKPLEGHEHAAELVGKLEELEIRRKELVGRLMDKKDGTITPVLGQVSQALEGHGCIWLLGD